jgi:hypothetical protein
MGRVEGMELAGQAATGTRAATGATSTTWKGSRWLTEQDIQRDQIGSCFIQEQGDRAAGSNVTHKPHGGDGTYGAPKRHHNQRSRVPTTIATATPIP